MLIAPYGDGRVNTLRLWEAHSPNDLDMYLFAAGSYVQSLEQRTMAEVITKVLYPADDHIEGKTLRIRQQYFFVSATAQSILRAHRARYGTVRNFAEHHVIQINDTHPTLIIPELMRLLLDDDGLGWDEAWISLPPASTIRTIPSCPRRLRRGRRASSRASSRACGRSSARSTAAGATTCAPASATMRAWGETSSLPDG